MCHGISRLSHALLLAVVALTAASATHADAPGAAQPGTRVLLDAHNCYPYHGRWGERIERALGVGPPLAIEQDLYWYRERGTGRAWSILSHGRPYTGREPTFQGYCLDRIRPVVEAALAAGDRTDWPLITLNLEFKSTEPEHLRAVWDALGEVEPWLCTAERLADPDGVAPLDVGPVLVLTGSDDALERAFHDAVPVGGRLRVFGAVAVGKAHATSPPSEIVSTPATNYRRWWNNPWSVVEADGQRRAGAWTAEDERRLKALVDHAHDLGLWIRFYTLNGHAREADQGWSRGYNFGDLEAARVRWRAAIRAGVDFVATDQYEAFGAERAAVARQGNTPAE